jgi:extradiol dioxygenase family protein
MGFSNLGIIITVPKRFSYGFAGHLLSTEHDFHHSTDSMTTLTATEELLDNTHVSADTGRYIAHIAVPCRDLDEAARWYSEVLGAEPVRILKDRVTFSFGGVLQLVCHHEKRALDPNPRAYPRHFGLTFLREEDFTRLKEHLLELGVEFVVRPGLRFQHGPHEHQTLMLSDPSGNVIEFKCYVRPECSY